MTWWVNDSDGVIELRDNDRVVAIFYTKDEAHEVLGLQDLADRQAQLLTEAVNVLRGEPPSDTLWSHHDIGEIAREIMMQLDRLGMFVALCRGSLPVYVDTAEKLLADSRALQARMRTPIRRS